MSTVRNWWKSIERRVASYFGTARTPLSGGLSKITRSDTLHPDLYIEVKARTKHSAVTLWRDTAAKAEKENKVPVVVLVERGKKGFWILVHSKDIDPKTIGEKNGSKTGNNGKADRGEVPSNSGESKHYGSNQREPR